MSERLNLPSDSDESSNEGDKEGEGGLPDEEGLGFSENAGEPEEENDYQDANDKEGDKKKFKKLVAKPHDKRSAARSQLQAISQLAASVNKLAEANAKRSKVRRAR